MIGNDVVDLKLAKIDSNWKRNGYLNKIFTDVEQNFILKSYDADKTVWILWTRKEAVYKILIQQGYKKGFYPKKIECLDEQISAGKVQFNSIIYFTNTTISNNCVHSVAVVNEMDLQKIRCLFWDENCFIIDGIPFYKTKDIFQNISKSHHGRYQKLVQIS